MRSVPSRSCCYLVLMLVLLGCTARVQPPVVVESDAVPIHLWEAGRHSGVILPTADGRGVGYEFGEWSWVLERKRGWWRFFPAMLWPSRGYLMRIDITDMHDAAAVAQAVHVDRLWTFGVQASRVRRLRHTLATRFQHNEIRAVAYYGRLAVPDVESYHLVNNCNGATGDWLRELGCSVAGDRLCWNWTVIGVTPLTESESNQ